MDDPLPDGNIWLQLLLLAALIFMNAFFAASEIAVISLNDNKIRRMADDGNKKAQRIMKLTADSSRFLATIQLGVTLAGFLTSAFAAQSLSEPLSALILRLFPSLDTAVGAVQTVSMILITVIMSYFSLVLGELVPKRIAMQKAEKLSFAVCGILSGLSVVMRPFIAFLSLSTNFIVRLFGMDPHAGEENMTEEEIRMMVDVGGEKGVIEDVQKEMIDNIFEFDDITAADIMTPRTEVESVEVEDGLVEALRVCVDYGFSRLPVYQDDIDNVVGLLYVKDLLPYVGQAVPKHVTIRHIMREAHFVPGTKRCGDLFAEMSEKRIHFAIVVDEYGGFDGIVTMEDLVESIVGNIQDEFDHEEDEVTQLDDDTLEVDGSIDIEELGELIGLRFPEGEYETLAGYIIDVIGRIPQENEQPVVTFGGAVLTVMEMEERRIARVHVKLPVPESAEDSGKLSKASLASDDRGHEIVQEEPEA